MQTKHHDSALSFKIILLGDANVGKTCFIKQYIDHSFVQSQRVTCNVDFVLKTCQVDEFRVKLNIFDTAGQQRFRSLTKSYFKGADAVLFMYDMSKQRSQHQVKIHSLICQNGFSFIKDNPKVCRNQEFQLEPKKIYGGMLSPKWAKTHKKKQQQRKKSNHSSKSINFYSNSKHQQNAVFEQITRNLIFDSLQKKKKTNNIREQEWDGILKRDKLHLMKQDEKNSQCC